MLAKMFDSDAKRGGRIRRLWEGNTSAYRTDWESGHHVADLALCRHLAYWTNGDRGQVDRLFRQSGLFRAKWDERHYSDGRTYGEATIDKALAGRSGA